MSPEVGVATGALLGPAALGALSKAVLKRSDGESSADSPYWFYVEQSTPMFGLEEYKQVGEVTPGYWYLAKGTYGEWIHAADQNSTLEGWVAGWAVKRAASS